MLDHRTVARGLLAAFCAVQGAATVAIDCNRTHATNPLWVRHARFHVVWQTIGVAILSAAEVALLVWHGDGVAVRFYAAAGLAAVSPVAFLIAFACERLFGGALSDPNGIPPVLLRVRGSALAVDLNLVAVLAGLVYIPCMLWIFG